MEGNSSLFENSFKSDDAVDVNKFFKELKFHVSLHTSYAEISSYISTMIGPVDK